MHFLLCQYRHTFFALLNIQTAGHNVEAKVVEHIWLKIY
jgi:hypothetical protein